MKRYCIGIILLIIALTGCAPLLKGGRELSDVSYGQLTIFLNGPERTSLDITFNLTEVSVVARDGTWKQVMNTPLSLNSIDMVGRQVLLGERYLPEERYEKIRFMVSQALLKRKGRLASLAVHPEGIELDINVAVYEGQNTSLFLNWSPDTSIVDGYLFTPVFALKTKVPELRTLLIYVTNEGSDNVSVVNRQLGAVVATIKVGKAPRGIAISTTGERIKVYVANSGSNTISVIDPTTNKVEYEIPIKFGREPEGIALATIASGRDFLFVANYASNTVSVIDTVTYQEVERIGVGNGPIAVAADPPIETLAAARGLGFQDLNRLRSYRGRYFNVYVANKNSNNVSILKMDASRNRCQEVINLGLEWSPMALAVDYQKGKVYVANYGSNNLSVIDLLQIIEGNKAGALSTITNVGTSGIGVAIDPHFDRIYLLRESPGEVVFIKPLSEISSHLRMIMTPITGTVAVRKSPRAISMDPEARKLYVVNRGSNTISVIDKTTKKEEQVIPVSERPYGIAVFPY